MTQTCDAICATSVHRFRVYAARCTYRATSRAGQFALCGVHARQLDRGDRVLTEEGGWIGADMATSAPTDPAPEEE